MANQKIQRSKEEIQIYLKNQKKLLYRYAIGSGIISALINGFVVAGGRARGGYIQQVPKNPFLLLYYGTFFQDSFFNFLVIFLLIFGGIFYFKFILEKRDANLDERNFEISKSGVYGTSHEMDVLEREKILHADMDPANMTNGILGRDRVTNECLEVKPDLPPVDQIGVHKFVQGTTGKRKSRSQVIPDILQMIKRGESCICTDPKGELYELLAILAKELGYIVKVFNLVHPINSDSCAFLKLVGKNTMMAQTMAEVLVENSSEGKEKGSIWQKGEKALIAFGILAIAMDKSIPDEEKTLYAVYDYLVNQSIEEIEDKADNMPITNPAKRQWNIFKTCPEKVRDGIRTNLATDLQLMMEPTIQAITSYDEIDLEMPGRQKCLYFIIMSDQEDTLNYFSAVFYSFLFIKLVKYADRRPGKKCRVPVNMMMEEFPNIGKIPGFPKKLNTIRSRDIRVTIICQDIGQMMDMYEGHTWESIIGACDTQICLGVNDTETTAGWWSRRSGTLTVEVHSTKKEKHVLAPINLQPVEQETEGKGKRPLIMPDEIASMPRNQSLVFISGYHMLKVKKFDYTEHPLYEQITLLNASDHEPEWWVKVKDEVWFQEMYAELEEEKEQIRIEEEEYLRELEAEKEEIEKENLMSEATADEEDKNTFSYDVLKEKIFEKLIGLIPLIKQMVEEKLEVTKKKVSETKQQTVNATVKKSKPLQTTSERPEKKDDVGKAVEEKAPINESKKENDKVEESKEKKDTEEKPFEEFNTREDFLENDAWVENQMETVQEVDKELENVSLLDDDDMDVEDFWNMAEEEISDDFLEEYEDSPYEDQEDVFGDDFFTKEGKDKYKPSEKKSDRFAETEF